MTRIAFSPRVTARQFAPVDVGDGSGIAATCGVLGGARRERDWRGIAGFADLRRRPVGFSGRRGERSVDLLGASLAAEGARRAAAARCRRATAGSCTRPADVVASLSTVVSGDPVPRCTKSSRSARRQSSSARAFIGGRTLPLRRSGPSVVAVEQKKSIFLIEFNFIYINIARASSSVLLQQWRLPPRS